jgi:predicted RNase H-like nuclease
MRNCGGAGSLVIGVDGCKFGWIAITLDTNSWVITHTLHPDGVTLFSVYSESEVIAIDIPIGLTEQGARACDQAARSLLGQPRSSSVFPAPIRPALAARNREEADLITREADGRGVGAQAWNIYNRVRDMDGLLRSSNRLRERVYEAHPEVCFRALNGGRSMTYSKHRREGLDRRRCLIDQYFGSDSFARVRLAYPKAQVSDDDILDAFAVCWTANRILRSQAVSLPEHPPFDAHGLPMRILY